MVRKTREAADGDRVRRDETGDKTAATASDERDGDAGGVMYADEGPYTFDVRHLCLACIAKCCDGRF